MIITSIGIGIVFASATLIAMAYERRMDVLYGPYIEGTARVTVSVKRFRETVGAVADGLRWKARNMAYVASGLGC
jgi:hypothetical protein